MVPRTLELLRGYELDQRRRALRPNTIRRRMDDLRSYARYIDVPILEATAPDIEAWLATRGKEPRTRASLVSCVSCFYQWAIREEFADRDPTTRVPRPKLRRYLPRPISDDDLSVALKMATPTMRAWLALMAYAGLRCQEVAGIDVGHLMWHTDPPLLLVAEAKGGNERTVPLALEAELAIRNLGVPRSGHLFRKPNGNPFTPANVSRLTSVYLTDVGIDATAHQLRHWFGSRVYGQTLDLRATQELMGHASPTTTAIYTAFATGAATAVVRSLSVSV